MVGNGDPVMPMTRSERWQWIIAGGLGLVLSYGAYD